MAYGSVSTTATNSEHASMGSGPAFALPKYSKSESSTRASHAEFQPLRPWHPHVGSAELYASIFTPIVPVVTPGGHASNQKDQCRPTDGLRCHSERLRVGHDLQAHTGPCALVTS